MPRQPKNGNAALVNKGGSARSLNDLPEGDVFGELAAIDGKSRATDIVSVTDALIASMSADLFWEVLRQYEPVWAATLRRLTGIARTAVQRVVELSTLPVRSRVHSELLRLASNVAPGRNRTIAVIDPAPTHAEIASRISTHRKP